MASSALIETEELAGLIESGAVVYPVDFTLNMTDPEEPQRKHFEHRIPSARFIKFSSAVDASAPVPMTLPKEDAFRGICMRLEIPKDENLVVVYDQLGMLGGARGWFLFRYFGRANVRILNGGLPKWLSEGRNFDAGEY
jgi:thiosulfate/3-mercaptopyruvate sulfurtransferase